LFFLFAKKQQCHLKRQKIMVQTAAVGESIPLQKADGTVGFWSLIAAVTQTAVMTVRIVRL